MGLSITFVNHTPTDLKLHYESSNIENGLFGEDPMFGVVGDITNGGDISNLSRSQQSTLRYDHDSDGGYISLHCLGTKYFGDTHDYIYVTDQVITLHIMLHSNKDMPVLYNSYTPNDDMYGFLSDYTKFIGMPYGKSVSNNGSLTKSGVAYYAVYVEKEPFFEEPSKPDSQKYVTQKSLLMRYE
jgi:hypothetical protein